MILADTSVWVDHLRERNQILSLLLDAGQVVIHPFVIGELALGTLRQRALIINALEKLPVAGVATHREVLLLIDRHALFGLGIGYIDAHLLAATRLTADTRIWTRDKRLLGVAERLGVGWGPPRS